MGHDHRHDSWDERAADYDASSEAWEPGLAPVTAALLDAAHVGPGTKVLDLACGPGHTTAEAQRRGAHVVGLDLTLGMVEAARRRYPSVPFVVGDMRDPPPGPWDAITCRGAAHHVDPEWFAAAWRVLAPGGRLAIAEPGVTDPESVAKGMRPAQEWARLLEGAGFRDVRITTVPMDGVRHEGADHHGHVGARKDDRDGQRHGGHPGNAGGSHAWPAGPMHVVSGSKPGPAGPAGPAKARRS